MSDDEPQPSKNPFIRFRRHVDSHVGTGLHVLTGTSGRVDRAPTGASNSTLPPPPQPTSNPLENMDRAPKPPPTTSWVDSLLGSRHEALGVHGSTRQYWNEWAQLSPYSPYNLRHLPQPVPAGVSSEDADLFDFEDALEDLLAVSSGRGLMDLRKQADRKRRILDTFHFGEPPMLWVNRLSARGLLPDPLLPRHAPEMSPDLAAAEAQSGLGSAILEDVEAQRQRLNTIESQRQALKEFFPDPRELNQRWESLKEKMLKELDKDIVFNPAKMLRQAEEMLRNLDNDVKPSLESVLDEFDLDKFLHDDDEHMRMIEQKAQGQQKPKPDTEEGFFSAILGALTEMEKSIPVKSFAGRSQKNEARSSYETSEGEEGVEYDENGGKTIRTSSEHVDMFGYMHKQTEVRKVDADGNQISCETTVVVRPATDQKLRKPTEEAETESSASAFQDEKAKVSTGNKGKSTGWFWR